MVGGCVGVGRGLVEGGLEVGWRLDGGWLEVGWSMVAGWLGLVGYRLEIGSSVGSRFAQGGRDCGGAECTHRHEQDGAEYAEGASREEQG